MGPHARVSSSPKQVQHEESQGVPVDQGQFAHHVAQGCGTGSSIWDICSSTGEVC